MILDRHFGEFDAHREQVRRDLERQVKSFDCPCGKLKPTERLFCQGCNLLLVDAGLWNMAQDIYSRINFAAKHGYEYDYRLYDALCDAVNALHSGLWNGRPKRRSLEEAA